MNRSVTLLLPLLFACGESTLEMGEGETDLSMTSGSVSCNPQMNRFPVNAPHNIGYDAASCGGSCATSCPDQHANSDFGGQHHGNDVFAYHRAPLVAVVSGTVTRAGVASSTSGIRVTIADGCGWWYYYGHLDEAVVGVGQHVEAGQLIGYMGNSGAPSTHLHFNVSRDGDYYNDIDPFGLLQATSATACGGGAASGPDQSVGLDLCTNDQRNACGFYGCGCFFGACAGGVCAPLDFEPKYRTLTGDFNGDKKTDVLTITALGGGGWASWASVDLSTGSGFRSATWGALTPQHMRNGGASNDYRVLTGDFNGDGKTDLATISKNGGGGWASFIAMELSTGSGFSSATWNAATPQHMRNGNNANDYRFLTGDFNGDGKTDIATITKNGGGGWASWVAMELSTGSGFVSTVWGAATPQHMRNGGVGADYRFLTGDFNGDGKTDLATITRTGGGGWAQWVAMELSTGSGFVSTTWGAATPQHMRNGGVGGDYRVLAADFNGDGKTDIATITPNGGGGWASWVAVELSTGSGFKSQTWGAATPGHMRNGGNTNDYRVLTGDFNGDGKADLATMTPNGGGGWADWAALELSTGTGFSSTVFGSPTPQHMRNGGAADYRILAGDFDGNTKTDLLTLSPSGGGGWAAWASVDLSTGSAFYSGVWGTPTPQHMRNGGL